MLQEDHKVEESGAIKNNKEAFSVSLDIFVLNPADTCFLSCVLWVALK